MDDLLFKIWFCEWILSGKELEHYDTCRPHVDGLLINFCVAFARKDFWRHVEFSADYMIA